MGDKIKWNFTKFLIGRDGQVVKRFGSVTKPEKLAKDIEKQLGTPPPPEDRRPHVRVVDASHGFSALGGVHNSALHAVVGGRAAVRR